MRAKAEYAIGRLGGYRGLPKNFGPFPTKAGQHQMATSPATAARYYEYLSGSDRLLARARDFICPLAPIIRRIPRNALHLDIGCGRGFLLGAAAVEKNTQSIGCELSESAVVAAKRLTTSLATKSDCHVPDVVQASTPEQWPIGPFDVVTIVDVLHHVPPPDQPALLIAAARRVRPGGLLLFKDIAFRPRWKRAMSTLHDLIVAQQLVHFLPLDQSTTVLRLQGLDLVETERYAVLWYAHELALLHRPI